MLAMFAVLVHLVYCYRLNMTLRREPAVYLFGGARMGTAAESGRCLSAGSIFCERSVPDGRGRAFCRFGPSISSGSLSRARCERSYAAGLLQG